MPGCTEGACCAPLNANTPRYRRVLWIALGLNALMFVIEVISGWQADSVSLLADAIDFAGDAANYGISLAVIAMATGWRAKAAWIKGATMFGFGAFIAAQALWSVVHGQTPEPLVMGGIALLALLVNAGVALMLYAFREGDANMRSVWLCSRNDAIGNVAVFLAALGVFGTQTRWPDLAVAAIMAALALSAGASVMRQARAELRAEVRTAAERDRSAEQDVRSAHRTGTSAAPDDSCATGCCATQPMAPESKPEPVSPPPTPSGCCASGGCGDQQPTTHALP